MITIHLVMPTGGSRGGVENVIKAWTRRLDPVRFDLRIFHISPGQNDYLDGYEKQYTLPLPDDGLETLTVQYCAQAYHFFLEQMGAPDICIATWIPMVSQACVIARNAKGMKFPVVSWIHGELATFRRDGWGDVPDMLGADAHFCISGEIERAIRERSPQAKTFFIGNPVMPVSISAWEPEDKHLCFVSRIVPGKNPDIILRAMNLAADRGWTLTVAGDGLQKEEAQTLASELGIAQRVHFAGWTDRPWEVCKRAHALVIASDHEGFCVSTLEASSIGMTVISTPVSGCTDYIVPGKNGYFFAHGDALGLADILDAISAGKLGWCDPDVCRESVVPYLSDNYFRHLTEILQQLVSEGKRIM